VKEDIENWYDEEYWRRFPVWPRRVRQIFAHIELEASDRVCEFGCGLGHNLFEIRDSIESGLGLDLAKLAVAEAEKTRRRDGIDNLAFEVRNIEALVSQPELRDVFTKVLMLDVSEHLYDDTLRGFLASARHVLVPGGSLWIHTPNAGYYLEIMKAHGILLRQFPSHIAVRNADAYVGELERSGFSVERVLTLPHYRRALGAVDRPLMRVPWIGRLFRSRLLIEARTA